ncbi:hypothetical protein M0804_000147 [Polistes exclamans]|nr:hypothetical protein M0804_000147 [Polistes exclamans]
MSKDQHLTGLQKRNVPAVIEVVPKGGIVVLVIVPVLLSTTSDEKIEEETLKVNEIAPVFNLIYVETISSSLFKKAASLVEEEEEEEEKERNTRMKEVGRALKSPRYDIPSDKSSQLRNSFLAEQSSQSIKLLFPFEQQG